MSRLSWLLGLIACLIILVPGAYSIEIHLSGSGGSISISGSPDVGIHVPVGEVIPTGFGQSTIIFSGFSDMNTLDNKPFKSATGVFDFTIFKAPTQVQFPKVYK